LNLRALLINQFFHPDVAATAQLLSDLAEDLASAGERVGALASKGSYASNGGDPLPAREDWRGVEIRRVACTDFGRGSVLGRVSDYATFLGAAGLHTARNSQQDVTVCLSTPPLVAVLGRMAGRNGSKFVYKVEDLYPDVAVALGTISEGSIADRVFSRLSRWLLSGADAVVALDEAMAQRLKDRGARRVEVIPNWADGEAIRPDKEAGERFRREHDIEDRFVVLYSGNLGLAHRFVPVVEAAKRLEESKPEALVLFVGGGPRLEEVRAAVEGQSNVRFLPYQPRERLDELYNAADVHLVTLRDEVAGLLVPSKYAAALAAGKPVLLVGGRGADLFEEIQEARVGWALDHDPRLLEDAIVEAIERPAIVQGMGSRARALFDRKYSRTRCTEAWADLLRDVVAGVDRERNQPCLTSTLQ
jgi:glycosyltransferase involved in cell wall biosynthesis